MARSRYARRSRNSLRNKPVEPSPPVESPPAEDVEMDDAPEEAENAEEDENEDVEEEQEEQEEAELVVSPVPNEDEPEFVVQKEPSPRTPSPPIEIPKKRRIGRPPKYPRPERSTPNRDSDGTPQRRKRGRPPGWRARGRGMGPVSTKVKIDKEGTLADVEADETVLPPDPDGEKKVDKDGNLLGGREYRVRTFTILHRKNRLYMLSTEPARCCGFRDSYLFFTKHLQLYKVVIEEDEKRDLIEREIIPHSYKGRSIGVVTARSVFREFGSRIVVGGKTVTDDYKEAEARARGDVEGELADPHDQLPAEGQPYNRNQYVAWHGASAVYHTNLPNIPIQNGKPLPGQKRRTQITSANWQFEHARAASQFNSALVQSRKAAWDGVYDPHTNIYHFPKNTQPTHAKWEQLPPSQAPEPEREVSTLTTEVIDESNGTKSKYEPVSAVVAHNYLVTDTVYMSPPISGAADPGTGGGAQGLPVADEETLAMLPPECRDALLDAKKKESEWAGQWSNELADGMRAKLHIGFMGFPV